MGIRIVEREIGGRYRVPFLTQGFGLGTAVAVIL